MLLVKVGIVIGCGIKNIKKNQGLLEINVKNRHNVSNFVQILDFHTIPFISNRSVFMTDTKSTATIYFRLCIAYFCQFAIWGSWGTTLGGYADKVLGFNAGILYIAIPIAATSALFIGPLVDRKFAAQKMLAFLHLCGGICLLLCAFQKNFYFLFFIMLLRGLFLCRPFR